MNIEIYSRKSLHTSYSCILYLKQELEKYGKVTLWSHTPNNDIGDEYKKNSFSFYNTWYGKLRGIRVYLPKIQFFFSFIHGNKSCIIHDLDFFIPAYFAKLINKKLKVIHYNTEIHGEDVKYPKYITSFYSKHAGFPDLIIECLQERAEYRKKTYNIKKHIYVINNTLPITEPKDCQVECSYIKFKEDLPILIYTGGCGRSRGLGAIIDSMNELKGKCNFLFFLDDSNKNAFSQILNECELYIKEDMCHIYSPISRDKLFMYQRLCDVGINYYRPEISINHKYASPTKLFEYMANGLKIVSTNNIGINKLIESEKIGYCFNDDSEFSKAVIRVIEDNTIKTKQEICDIFAKKYCYEINSVEAIQAILNLTITAELKV